MHKLNVKELPQLKPVDLNAAKVIAIFASVLLFFILPIIGIESLNQNQPIQNSKTTAQNTSGRVAGVSTQSTNQILGLDLSNEATIFLIGGILLIGIAAVLIIFLIVDSQRSKKGD